MYAGMRTAGDSKDIDDKNCFAMANMKVTQKGGVSSRNGFDKQNSTSLGAACLGLCGYIGRPGGTPTVVVADGTKMETL